MADFIKLVDLRAPAPDDEPPPGEETPCKFEFQARPKCDVYQGPYPLKSLQRIRKLFVEGLFGSSAEANASASHERMVEILKMKLRVKSRLDGNQAALGQIQRETAQFKELIDRRMDLMEKRLGSRREVARYFNAVTSSANVIRSQ